MTDTNHRPADGTDRKAVLFCPVCGHKGPYDGAWSVDRGADGGRTEVECPDCGELVVGGLVPADPTEQDGLPVRLGRDRVVLVGHRELLRQVHLKACCLSMEAGGK